MTDLAILKFNIGQLGTWEIGRDRCPTSWDEMTVDQATVWFKCESGQEVDVQVPASHLAEMRNSPQAILDLLRDLLIERVTR